MPFKEKEYNKTYQKKIRNRRKQDGVCSIDAVAGKRLTFERLTA
jgi:hypothetical protein